MFYSAYIAEYEAVMNGGLVVKQVCMNGRNMFMGYLGAEEKTRETLDEDGWVMSGDLGRRDDRGFVYITGRIKGIYIHLFLNVHILLNEYCILVPSVLGNCLTSKICGLACEKHTVTPVFRDILLDVIVTYKFIWSLFFSV